MATATASAQLSGEVASRYSYRDGAGELGMIASVTRPFCGPVPEHGYRPTARSTLVYSQREATTSVTRT